MKFYVYSVLDNFTAKHERSRKDVYVLSEAYSCEEINEKVRIACTWYLCKDPKEIEIVELHIPPDLFFETYHMMNPLGSLRTKELIERFLKENNSYKLTPTVSRSLALLGGPVQQAELTISSAPTTPSAPITSSAPTTHAVVVEEYKNSLTV